jgi:hypothetical protein
MPGGVIDWDETKEDPAFALLASQARYAATVFDFRMQLPFRTRPCTSRII